MGYDVFPIIKMLKKLRPERPSDAKSEDSTNLSTKEIRIQGGELTIKSTNEVIHLDIGGVQA